MNGPEKNREATPKLRAAARRLLRQYDRDLLSAANQMIVEIERIKGEAKAKHPQDKRYVEFVDELANAAIVEIRSRKELQSQMIRTLLMRTEKR